MKALSIHQPWAHAILHLGKNVENRRWATKYRGPLLIHASLTKKSYELQSTDDWRERFGVELPPWESLALGAVIGVVELVDCVRLDRVVSPWADGPCCWLLKNPKTLVEPIAVRGMQALFEIDHDFSDGFPNRANNCRTRSLENAAPRAAWYPS